MPRPEYWTVYFGTSTAIPALMTHVLFRKSLFLGLLLSSLACNSSSSDTGEPHEDSDGAISRGDATGDDRDATGIDAPGSSDGAETDSDGASFTAVQAIFDDRCVICHDATKLGLPTYPALPLTRGSAQAALVNRPALETCGGTYVVPGDPDRSYLIHKVADPSPCFGARMPMPFEVGRMIPLTVEQIAIIRAWIADGAVP